MTRHKAQLRRKQNLPDKQSLVICLEGGTKERPKLAHITKMSSRQRLKPRRGYSERSTENKQNTHTHTPQWCLNLPQNAVWEVSAATMTNCAINTEPGNNLCTATRRACGDVVPGPHGRPPPHPHPSQPAWYPSSKSWRPHSGS